MLKIVTFAPNELRLHLVAALPRPRDGGRVARVRAEGTKIITGNQGLESTEEERKREEWRARGTRGTARRKGETREDAGETTLIPSSEREPAGRLREVSHLLRFPSSSQREGHSSAACRGWLRARHNVDWSAKPLGWTRPIDFLTSVFREEHYSIIS